MPVVAHDRVLNRLASCVQLRRDDALLEPGEGGEADVLLDVRPGLHEALTGNTEVENLVVVRGVAEREVPRNAVAAPGGGAERRLDAGVADRAGVERLLTRETDRGSDVSIEDRVDRFLVVVSKL